MGVLVPPDGVATALLDGVPDLREGLTRFKIFSRGGGIKSYSRIDYSKLTFLYSIVKR